MSDTLSRITHNGESVGNSSTATCSAEQEQKNTNMVISDINNNVACNSTVSTEQENTNIVISEMNNNMNNVDFLKIDDESLLQALQEIEKQPYVYPPPCQMNELQKMTTNVMQTENRKTTNTPSFNFSNCNVTINYHQ